MSIGLLYTQNMFCAMCYKQAMQAVTNIRNLKAKEQKNLYCVDIASNNKSVYKCVYKNDKYYFVLNYRIPYRTKTLFNKIAI